jgi:hypothetical protein
MRSSTGKAGTVLFLTLAVACLASFPARAQAPEPVSLRIVSEVNGGEVGRSGPAEWGRAARVTLHAVLEALPEGEGESVFYTRVEALEIDGEAVAAQRVRRWPEEWGKPSIRWYRVMNRSQLETPGAPWDRFEQEELPAARDAWSTDVRPGVEERRPGIPPFVGTARYALTVDLPGGESLGTPGAEFLAGARGREADRVYRVTMRRDSSFAGWVCAYMGVPFREDATLEDVSAFAAVSGVGLPLGAYAALTGSELPEIGDGHYRQEPWRTLFQLRGEDMERQGAVYRDEKGRPIRWGEGAGTVRQGDLLVSQGVVAILWADSGRRGRPNREFDPWDRVIAADGAPARLATLDEVLPEPFVLLRFRDFTFLQSHLRSLDLYRGKRTGALDAATQSALRRFQEGEGLETTGFPDQPTLAALLRAVRDRLKE